MQIRLVDVAYEPEWLRMRQALWPDCPAEQHRREMRAILAALPETPVFVAVRANGGLCGFLEASLRNYADLARRSCGQLWSR